MAELLEDEDGAPYPESVQIAHQAALAEQRERIGAAIEAKRPHTPPSDHPKRRQYLIQRVTFNRAARIARGGEDRG